MLHDVLPLLLSKTLLPWLPPQINEGHREVAYFSLMPGAAKWEIEVDGVWKVPPSLELIAWLEDQYLNNKQSKVNLRGSLQVSGEVQFGFVIYKDVVG